MAKKRIIDVPQTKGTFQVRGKVSGVKRDKFYIETNNVGKKPFRKVNFGIEFDEDKRLYVQLSGTPQDNVYFSKRKDGDEIFPTIKTPWAKRLTIPAEGYKIIGASVGLEKDEDDKNIKEALADFDAVDKIAEDLRELGDGTDVYVYGNIEFNEYNGNTTPQYVIKQIYLAQETDFKDEKFSPLATFEIDAVITSVEPNAEKSDEIKKNPIIVFDKKTNSETIINDSVGTVECQFVDYSKIYNFVLYTAGAGFGKSMQNHLKKTKSSFKVNLNGQFHASKGAVEEEVNDGWGVSSVQKQRTPTIVEMYATYANLQSLNEDDYTTEKMDEAIQAIKATQKAKEEFVSEDTKNGNDGWGTLDSPDDSNPSIVDEDGGDGWS